MNISNAIVYDLECFPNAFTCGIETLYGDTKAVWELSEFRDDKAQLLIFLNYLSQNQIPMIGFNNISFDYVLIHMLMRNPQIGYRELYQKCEQIIHSNDRFGNTIWASDRLIPQIDLRLLHHLDNPAKATSLKYLQVNMRTDSVEDMPIENGTVLTKEQIDTLLVPYNQHDVKETKAFTLHSMDAINFRLSLIPQHGVEVMNWNDTKIGEQTVINKLGKDVCYDYSTGRRQMRQTPRDRLPLSEVIFPLIKFDNLEFNRVLNYLKQQVLKADELEESNSIVTKGVFTDLRAHVGNVDFYFGTGGIHGSLERKRAVATDEWLIRDIDVEGMYPRTAVAHGLAPEHLGSAFTAVYSEIPKERKRWQAEKGKKCAEANALKLAANGVYGKSNSKWSVFFDPKFTMQVTLNGQLMLAMLIEKLVTIPTLQVLAANTDGITYFVHRDYEPTVVAFSKEWEKLTGFTLEGVNFKRIWLRDCNNYVAENMDGSLKLKGAYSYLDPLDYFGSISNAQPPQWHRDLSNQISTRAAVAHMVWGCDIEQFIRMCSNPYDFMCAVKTRGGDTLMWKGQAQQKRATRYYITHDGAPLTKQAPAMGVPGAYKKANGVSDALYAQVMAETRGEWDMRVCTKNKSKYDQRVSQVCAGYNVTICNDVRAFRFDNIDYSWYVQEAAKLVI